MYSMIEEGRVDPIGDELPPPPNLVEDAARRDAEEARRDAEEARARAPFVVAVVAVPRVARRRRRVPVEASGGADEEADMEGEEPGVNFR